MNRSTRIIHKLAVLLVCIVVHGNVFANTLVDSLFKELSAKNADDTSRVPILIDLCNYYSQNKQIDSLNKYVSKIEALLDETNEPGYKSSYLTFKGDLLYFNRHFDSAITLYKKALVININNDYTELSAAQYNNIGNVHMRLGNYSQALSYYDTTIDIAEKIDNRILKAHTINNVATIYYEQGAYVIALKKFLESLRLNEANGDEKSMVSNYNNITNIYFRLDDFEKAKEYAAKSVALSEKTATPWGIVSSYVTYAMIHSKVKDYDSSLAYLLTADSLANQVGSAYLSNILKQNIAECYLHKNERDKAYRLYKESEETSVALDDQEGIAVAKAGIGQVLMERGKKRDGAAYMKQAIQLMMEGGMKEQVVDVATTLSEACEKSGDYAGAVKYLKIKEQYKDSLGKVESAKEAQSLEFKYLLEKKENELTLLQKDRAIEMGILKQQRILLTATVIGLVLASIIAILIFRNLRDARKNNALILKQKEEIEEQAQKLEELNTFKDTTFSVLSHDLRSPINALTGTMSLLDEGVITPEEFKEYKGELNNKLQSVSLMLDNLLQWAKSQMKGEHILEKDDIDLHQKVQTSLNIVKDAAKQKNIALTNNVDKSMSMYADPNQIEMVLRNLISNAVKFTPNGGSVSVSAARKNGHISVDVSDTGMGMTQEQIKQLFDGNTNNSSLGTGGEKGTGIGLQLSHAFVKSNGGDINVKSELGAGTTFSIILPAN